MTALAPVDTPDLAATGEIYPALDPIQAALVSQLPEQKFPRFGINLSGQLYQYGDSPATPGPSLDAETGLPFYGIHDLRACERAGSQRKVYLDVALGSAHPYQVNVLSLPVFNNKEGRSSWPVRSLLGALLVASELSAGSLDMRALSGKICAIRGTRPNADGYVANFLRLFLAGDPSGAVMKQLPSGAIDPDRDSFEMTVNRLRRALALEPQFL